MMKITILGLVLVAIALSSATSVASTEIVPSPLQQMRDGVPTDEVVCSEDSVLMASQSGMPACVFVDSVFVLDKRGFVLLGEITSNVFPISASADPSNTSMIPAPSLSMSRLPNLGETAVVEIRFANWYDIDILDTEKFRSEGFTTGWLIGPTFEIVDAGGLLYDTVKSYSGFNITETEPQPGYSRYEVFTPLDADGSITYRIVVRVVSEGYGTIAALGYKEGSSSIDLYIDGEETMSVWDHMQLYPEKHARLLPVTSDGPPSGDLTKEEMRILEEHMAAQKEHTREETMDLFTNYLINSGNSAEWAVSLLHSGVLNATELRTVLAGANFTNSEIDMAMADNVANIP